jgi:hypothetical protein
MIVKLARHFLSRPLIGERNGIPVKRKRMWRAFFMALIAGGRPVIMNVDIEDGSIRNVNDLILANSTFRISKISESIRALKGER